MQISVENRDADLLIALTGDFDHHAAKEVTAKMCRAIDTYLPKRLAVDLGRLSFMDSSGIAALIKCKRMMDELGGEFAVVGAGKHVKRLFQASGLSRVMDIA